MSKARTAIPMYRLEPAFARKFALYFVIGGICALTDWAFFALFLYRTDLHYLVGGVVSFVIATALNWALSVRFVFVSGRHHRHLEILMVYVASAIGLAINLAVLSGSIEYLGFHPMVAKVLGTGVAFVWNFGARYLWIFQR